MLGFQGFEVMVEGLKGFWVEGLKVGRPRLKFNQRFGLNVVWHGVDWVMGCVHHLDEHGLKV